MSWVAWAARIACCLLVALAGYRLGLLVGHGRGYHEAMKLASRMENEE